MGLFIIVLLFAFISFTFAMITSNIKQAKSDQEIENTVSWYYFNKVLKENEIKTGYDFAHFMTVIEEHGKNKSYTEIKKIWKSHKDSIKDVVKSVKRRK